MVCRSFLDWPGIDINGVSKIVFSIIALTMYASGTLSEIIRPAYLSVDKGQMEAALMSALTPAQAIRLIILPQVVYVARRISATCSLP